MVYGELAYMNNVSVRSAALIRRKGNQKSKSLWQIQNSSPASRITVDMVSLVCGMLSWLTRGSMVGCSLLDGYGLTATADPSYREA